MKQLRQRNEERKAGTVNVACLQADWHWYRPPSINGGGNCRSPPCLVVPDCLTACLPTTCRPQLQHGLLTPWPSTKNTHLLRVTADAAAVVAAVSRQPLHGLGAERRRRRLRGSGLQAMHQPMAHQLADRRSRHGGRMRGSGSRRPAADVCRVASHEGACPRTTCQAARRFPLHPIEACLRE